MKNSRVGYLIVIVLIASCQPEQILLTPIAKINYFGNKDVSTTINLGVTDQLYIENLSSNASTYLWDLGNGTQLSYKNIRLSYLKSGVYTLKLTVTSSSGAKSSITKVVNVYDFVLKSVKVTNVGLNVFAGGGRGYPASVTFPIFSKVNLWVEIKKGFDNTEYPPSYSGDISAPVIFKSSIAKDIDADHPTPIYFNDFQERMAINIPYEVRNFTGSIGIVGGYAFNLYAQDASGTYLISTNRWSGSNNSFYEDIDKKTFTWISGGLGGGSIEMSGTLELP